MSSLPRLKLTESLGNSIKDSQNHTLSDLVAQVQGLKNRVEYIENKTPSKFHDDAARLSAPRVLPPTAWFGSQSLVNETDGIQILCYDFSAGKFELHLPKGGSPATIPDSIAPANLATGQHRIFPALIGIYAPICLLSSIAGFVFLQAPESRTVGLSLIIANIAIVATGFKIHLSARGR